MLKKKPAEKDEALENAIAHVYNDLRNVEPDSPEFAKMVDQLTKLYELKPKPAKDRISADTLVTVGANLAGIVLILGFEKANVITSKALGFVSKLKL